mgnify:CR=1 FL=1
MMKTPLSILIYHQHGHIGFKTNLLFYSAKCNCLGTIGSYHYSLIKMFCHNENVLSSEFYSAKNYFSIIKNISEMIYSFVYIWHWICCKMYLWAKKVKSLILDVLFFFRLFRWIVCFNVIFPRWVNFAAGSWPV